MHFIEGPQGDPLATLRRAGGVGHASHEQPRGSREGPPDPDNPLSCLGLCVGPPLPRVSEQGPGRSEGQRSGPGGSRGAAARLSVSVNSDV